MSKYPRLEVLAHTAYHALRLLMEATENQLESVFEAGTILRKSLDDDASMDEEKYLKHKRWEKCVEEARYLHGLVNEISNARDAVRKLMKEKDIE